MSKSRAVRKSAAPAAPQGLSTAAVFKENAPYAWRVLRRLGVPEADADDVCQEVFMTVHRRLNEFEGRSSVRTWVYGICVRTASDYRKRTHRRREVSSESPPEQPVAASQEEDLALQQARDTLDRILDRLDDDKRAVFVLYEIEALSMTEVSSVLGCHPQTAYSRLHAARREFEAAIARLRALEAARAS